MRSFPPELRSRFHPLHLSNPRGAVSLLRVPLYGISRVVEGWHDYAAVLASACCAELHHESAA